MTTQHSRPRWTLWTSIVLLFWALAGCAAFWMQYSATPEAISRLSPAEQEMWGHMPGWAWAAYAIAVVAGLGGALGLVLRRNWGVWLFPISLIAVLVQFSYAFIFANGLATLGAPALFLPAFIILMAALQSWLVRNWAAKGWLS